MYLPRFEITNKILRNIGAIEAAKELIENAPLIPSYEKRFKDEVAIRTVYHATRLDGNDLSLKETQDVIEGREIIGSERDIQEIINYRNVLRYVDEVEVQSKQDKDFTYKESNLLKIHSLVVERIIPKNEAGHYRQAQVVLKNSLTGEVVFRPPPAPEVPFYISELFDWLNKVKDEEMHPVLTAGISLYLLYSIHPFIEGNGRTARGFAALVLFAKRYDMRRIFSIEEYFDAHAEEYYQALLEVDKNNSEIFQRNLTPWLEFFTFALANELSSAKETIKKLSVDGKIKELLGGKQVSLSDRQVRLMEYLEEYGEIRTPDAKEIIPMVSEDTLLRDFQDLIKKGILRKKGTTKKATYILRSKGSKT